MFHRRNKKGQDQPVKLAYWANKSIEGEIRMGVKKRGRRVRILDPDS